MSGKPTSHARSTPWRDVIILCRKCSKKLDGGFGPKRKDSLKTVLRQALRDAGQRRQVRVMETSCLGICPKNGVTALNATRPGTLHVIQTGAGGADAMQALLGGNTIVDSDVAGDRSRVEAA